VIHLNIGEKQKKSNASEDLTVVLLRGNGSPRSFRVSLPALHRSLTAVGFLFALAIFASLVLLGFSLVSTLNSPTIQETPVAVAPAPVAPPTEAPITSADNTSAPAPGLWQQLKGTVQAPSGPVDSELQKEVAGLRQEIAQLSARLEDRKSLAPEANDSLIQFFGSRSTLMPEAQSAMRIKNPRVTKDAASKEITLSFELHNVDPQQNQQRGYIVALAKTPDLLLTYPNYALKPNENILLDFTKGETFAVSRFREAKATFPSGPLENRKTSYQILLFAHDGRVIGNMHVEGNK
jgi:hypothetical protein